jgi:hypothetical protein
MPIWRGARALRIDNVPMPPENAPPKGLAHWCPALGSVTVLATSRLALGLSGDVKEFAVDVIDDASAVRLLTRDTVRWQLSDSNWGRIVEWVGRLPLALDVLRAALRAQAVSPKQLLERIDAVSVTREVDAAKEALRGQVPEGALRGVTDALSISYERLKPAEQQAARLLAQLGPEAIPQRIIELFADAFSGPVKAALVARAWVTPTSAMDGTAADAVPLFGRMHQVVADFLRTQSSDADADRALARRALLAGMTDTDNPSTWAVLILLC